MANTNFQISFSIDLKPFGDGLKSMLVMTQAAGKQIQPLLNLQMKAPNFANIESELKKYEDRLKEIAGETATATTGQDEFGKKTEDAGKKAAAASAGVEKNALSMNKVKREALEVFGGVSFAATSMINLASRASGGSEQLDKLSHSMSEGISAGFGLASMMTLLGVASGGTAAIIGSVVTVGIALTNFLVDAKEKTVDYKQVVDSLSDSLRGASVAQLKQVEAEQIATIERNRKLTIASLDDARKMLQEKNPGILYSDDAVRLEKKNALEVIKSNEAALKVTTDAINNQQMNTVEVLKRTHELEIAGIKDKYERQREAARDEFRTEQEKAQASKATETEKNNYIGAARGALKVKITDIDEQEKQELEQKRKQDEAREREHQKLLANLNTETAKALNESEKQKELARTTSARERVAIEERYAIAELNIQEKLAQSFAQTEQEKTALTRKYEALRAQIRSQSSNKFIEAEKDDVETAKRSHEEQRRQWKETHDFEMAATAGMQAGVNEFWNQFVLVSRQPKDGWDAMWISMENTMLSALANMIVKEIENAAISIGLEEAKQTANLGTAATSAATGATKAGESAAALPFPANLIAIPLAIAAAITMFAGIKAAFGLQHGGRVRKGQTGFLEGYEPEIVAPEKTFTRLMREEFIPRQVVEQRVSGGVGGGEPIYLERAMKKLQRAVEQMPASVEVQQKGDDLYGVWRTKDKRYNVVLL